MMTMSTIPLAPLWCAVNILYVFILPSLKFLLREFESLLVEFGVKYVDKLNNSV